MSNETTFLSDKRLIYLVGTLHSMAVLSKQQYVLVDQDELKRLLDLARLGAAHAESLREAEKVARGRARKA